MLESVELVEQKQSMEDFTEEYKSHGSTLVKNLESYMEQKQISKDSNEPIPFEPEYMES